MDEPRSLWLEHDGVALHVLDFGGAGPPVLLLHGLAGYAGEWAESASWLRLAHRVLALDLRGHGASVRTPPVVTPEAFVGDVIAWLDSLQVKEAMLVGQSFGGLIAFLTAAAHPERIKRFVVAEAAPAPDPGAEVVVREWLDSWPVPFPDEETAIRFFGGDSVRARAWAGGLEAGEGGLWPRFDAEIVLRTLRETASGWWDAWSSIRCPTLVVRGEHGISAEATRTMVAELDDAVLQTVARAGHDVHLENPDEWRRIVQPFLASHR